MTHGLTDPDPLLARADAALIEAKRLIDESRRWQQDTVAQIRRMRFRASFQPQSLRLYSPLDFLPRMPPETNAGPA
jgi:hypothetical protein